MARHDRPGTDSERNAEHLPENCFPAALAYLADDSIPFDEIPGEFAGGTAGLFFTFTVDIPLNLEYNGADWQ